MRVLAVDLGATSVRVAAVDLAAPTPSMDVVHRWPHQPVPHGDGSLRWDWDGIVAAVETGLARGLEQGPVASIGIDGWAVDYGLLDDEGRLLSTPYSYRDGRTAGWRATAGRLGAERLYTRTGIQLMPINTVFQLAAHDRAELDRASRLLLLPDLLVHHLTGHVAAERSNATTTALVDVRTGDWDPELLADLGLELELFPSIEPAGRRAGTWRGVPVHTVGSHDTASAFVGIPGVPGPGAAVISAGTWVLVGAERPEADTSEAARSANFSNEGGALGGVRFLKNVMGFWMLERCRDGWGDPPVTALLDEAAAVTEPVPLVDASDERFLAPDDMAAEVRAAAGLPASAPRGAIVRCIIESIVAGIVTVTEELGTITGTPRDELFVVGGGARIELLRALLVDRTGLPVRVGSSEAAALGNAVVQGLALGRFQDLAAARRWLAGPTQETTGSVGGQPSTREGAR